MITQVTYVADASAEIGLEKHYYIVGIAPPTRATYTAALKDYMTECFNEIDKRYFANSTLSGDTLSQAIAKKVVIDTYNRMLNNAYKFERKEH